MRNSLTIFRPIYVLWRLFEAFSNFMDKFWQLFGVAILLGMWGLLLVNAIARWTGIIPIGWSIEITGYLVAWSIFVMIGPITRSDQQIKVTFVSAKLLGEKRGASFVFALESILGMIFCIYLSYHSFELVKNTYDAGYTEPSTGGWDYPMWIVRSCVLMGFSFAAIYYFERTVKWIQKLFTGAKVAAGGDALTAGVASAFRAEKAEPETGTPS